MELNFECPYCGKGHSVRASYQQLTEPFVTCCEAISGGCKKTFVVKVKLHISAVTLKIQEEEIGQYHE